MPPNGQQTRDGAGTVQNGAVVRELRNVVVQMLEVKDSSHDLTESKKEMLSEVSGKLSAFHSMVKKELCHLNKGIEALSTAVGDIPSALNPENTASVTSDTGHEKTLAMGCLAYCRLIVGIGLLGKGGVLDCFAKPSQPVHIKHECAWTTLGNAVATEDIEGFLDRYSTADRSGITAVLQPQHAHKVPSNRKKTIRDRVSLQRRRVHDMIVPKVVNARMKEAPGFSSYRFGAYVNNQKEDVLHAAKEAYKKDWVPLKPAYCNPDNFSRSKHEACKELMRVASTVLYQALADQSRIVPPERLERFKEEVKGNENEQGYPARGVHEYNERDGFLPQQLTFVIIKLSDLVSASEGRPKRGIELGHYHQRLKETIEISRIADGNSSSETRRLEYNFNSKPCDPITIYGVPIRGVLPDSDVGFIEFLLTVETSIDYGPERIRMRMDPELIQSRQ